MLICNKLYLFITVAGNQRLSGVEEISKQKEREHVQKNKGDEMGES